MYVSLTHPRRRGSERGTRCINFVSFTFLVTYSYVRFALRLVSYVSGQPGTAVLTGPKYFFSVFDTDTDPLPSGGGRHFCNYPQARSVHHGRRTDGRDPGASFAPFDYVLALKEPKVAPTSSPALGPVATSHN